MPQRNRRQVALAVLLLLAALLFLVGLPTIGLLIIGLFLVWWLLVIVRDMASANQRSHEDHRINRTP